MRASTEQYGNDTPSRLTRRQFIARGSGALAGFYLISTGCTTGNQTHESAISALTQGFENPPLRARPGAYWIWNDGYFDLEQMTRELEDLKEKGMSGLEFFDIGAHDSENIVPAGPAFMSPEALKGVAHGLQEARRLGLEMGLITSSSWNAGGPWVTPDIASKTLYHSETPAHGPGRVTIELPYPEVPEPKFKGREGGLTPWTADEVFSQEVAVLAVPANENRTITDLSDVIDLSDQLESGGRLTWDVPAGEWVVLRIVCTNNRERVTLPSPHSDGYMIDHLSAEATESHFRHIIDRLIDALGSLDSVPLKYLYLPSYEVRGLTEWTPTFEQAFRDRHGYEIKPFLPVLFGWTIANPEISERFDHDRRMMVSDLLIENHYKRAAEICHEYGLELHAESGGPGRPFLPAHDFPAEALSALNAVDVPRGEFWVRNPLGEFDGANVIKAVASAIHIYGKKVAEMESFTCFDHWERGPFDLKPFADRVFCEGPNRIVFHTYPHNPPEAGKPGWAYHAGTHVGMNRVWWPKARPFIWYLSRTSYLLQEGLFVADLAFYYGHDAPLLIANKGHDTRTETLGAGYDYDYVNTDVILNRMSVRNGRIVLPDGMSYALLVLPDRKDMPVEVAEKLERLVTDGATIVGPRPIRTPGLHSPDEKVRRERDARLNEIAERLWGDVDGRSVTSRVHGQGQVIYGIPLRDVLQQMRVEPDFTYVGQDPEAEIHFIHRQVGDTDIYFISNQKDRWEPVDCVFRVRSGTPEVWKPDTGQRQTHVLYHTTGSGTRVHLDLAPYGSTFVIFGPNEGVEPIVSVAQDGRTLYPVQPGQFARRIPLEIQADPDGAYSIAAWEPGSYLLQTQQGRQIRFDVAHEPHAFEIEGPWNVQFPPDRGAPDEVVFPKLISWTEHEDPGIRYFSGMATYSRAFELPADAFGPDKRLVLDLGKVQHVAEVYVNDQSVGIVWKPDDVLDITRVVVTGENRLRIEVGNVWANRLLGDRDRPDEQRFTRTNVPVHYHSDQLIPSGLLGPVRVCVGVRQSSNA